jgi:anion-transporting  ArsA/GET3 family ATPase
MARALPPILFVQGKGGAGRTTVASALGVHFASLGERVLIVQWALADSIGPWFGLPAGGHAPVEVAPRLREMNYSCEETLREYFRDHLGLRRFHDHVVAGELVSRAVRTVPGVQELLFLGRLFWLRALAPRETGEEYDRILIDAPAAGHGAPLLGVPASLRALGLAGQLAFEIQRVGQMLADPAQVGVLAVALPEELPLEETLELVARVERELSRPPLLAVVNRSAARLPTGGPEADPLWAEEVALAAQRPATQAAIRAAARALVERSVRERAFRAALSGALPLGVASVDDCLLLEAAPSPRAVVERLATQLGAFLGAQP